MGDAPIDRVDYLVRQHDIPEIIARLLIQRGIDADQVSSFLNPSLKKDFPDPFTLKGMGDMAEDVAIAIEAGKKFAIFGDFDVDGATSSAVMHRFLKACGVEAPVYIPDRLTEGYGPNIDALKQIRARGAEILMMLDCGSTAHEIIAAGAAEGLKIIIIDHHEVEETLPTAWHIINPKRKDDSSGLEMMAAVGVTFMACVAINNRLRDRGFFNDHQPPVLKNMLDLVALGTVCDMVPIKGVNRLLVRLGLAQINNTGMKALMQTAKLRAPLSTFDCGFVLGPRINAGGRIDKADLGAVLLCGEDEEECGMIAWTLHDCNEKRKAIQVAMEEEAVAMVEQRGLFNSPMIFVSSKDWHPGLSGLVAGKLKERYKKPACVVTFAENQKGVREGRGSGRSVAGVHIAQAFIDARQLGLVEKGGGHAMAGGFTVKPEGLEKLEAFLCDHIARQIGNNQANVEIKIDAAMTLRGVKVELIEKIMQGIGPFGQEAPEPVFLFQNIRIQKADILGQAHIRLMLGDEGGGRLKGMAFKAVGTTLGEALLRPNPPPIDILASVKVNDWQGQKTGEIHILDAALSQAQRVAHKNAS